MSAADFSVKDRLRFRKLLEVAYSTTFPGERDAALAAATKLAGAHGMTLHEAAGMKDPVREEARPQARPRGHAGFAADFGAAGPETMGRWWARQTARGRNTPGRDTGAQAADHAAATAAAREAAEKKRRDEALADAFRRGLDAEEIKAKAKAEARAARPNLRRPNSRSPWRSRPEFVRILLAETRMSAKEIAAVAGVTIYDVFREKLLMRRSAA